MVLEHSKLPPTLYYKNANPHINFAQTPFFVTSQLAHLEAHEMHPVRAGVSSFGVGGTNAHVILEQAPHRPDRGVDIRPQLITLSAKSEQSLRDYAVSMSAALESLPGQAFADAAFTIQVSRSQLPLRLYAVGDDTVQTAKQLAKENQRFQKIDDKLSEVVFLFSGQGAQSVNMGRELYFSQPVYQENFDRCADLFLELVHTDIRNMIFCDDDHEAAQKLLSQTAYTQPALFALEYSLAKLWMALGLSPVAMIGHSLGEFVAATLSGIFSIEDAVKIVAERAHLMQSMAPGAMLVVRAAVADFASMLPIGCELAAFNAPKLNVVSGPHEIIEQFAETIAQAGLVATKLQTSHAFHSRSMEPAAEAFKQVVAGVQRNTPSMTIISTMTGKALTDEQAVSASYWGEQLRQPVRFCDAVLAIADKSPVFLEVGPRETLASLVRAILGSKNTKATASGITGQKNEYANWLKSLGWIWQQGLEIDWKQLHHGHQPLRIPLPSYPFERKRYWIDAPVKSATPITDTVTSLPIQAAEPITAHIEVQMQTEQPIELLKRQLAELFEEYSGEDVSTADYNTEFLELGFDSLFLTQMSSAIKNRYRADVPFRKMVQEVSTISAMADYLAGQIDMSEFETTPIVAAMPAPANITPTATLPGIVPVTAGVIIQPAIAAASSEVATLFAQQLQILQQQLAFLTGNSAGAPVSTAIPESAPAPAPAPAPVRATAPRAFPTSLL
jgi:acyl transferase domain-containing protein